jgi:hypothetical protein
MHEVAPENAARMLEWVEKRGGVAVWKSVNLSNPGASWSTPALAPDCSPSQKPSWEASSEPHKVITDPAEIAVVTRKEVGRFRVAIRVSGRMVKLTTASSKRLDKAMTLAGEDASYHFDYETQEAVITVPSETVPLLQFLGK